MPRLGIHVSVLVQCLGHCCELTEDIDMICLAFNVSLNASWAAADEGKQVRTLVRPLIVSKAEDIVDGRDLEFEITVYNSNKEGVRKSVDFSDCNRPFQW
jgi:hypothetical protein